MVTRLLYSIALLAGLVLECGNASGQQTVFWRDNAANGNWENGGCGAIGTVASQWWYPGFNSNEARNRPDCFDGSTTRHNVIIDNNHQPTMTTNTAFWGLRSLTFASAATTNRTINSAPDDNTRGISVTNGIFNNANSGVTHTFNTRIGIDATTVTLSTATLGAISIYNREIFGNNNNIVFDGSGNTDVTAVISGAGASVTKNGSGTLTFSGSNSYSGATTITAGTLRLGAANVIADASNVTLNGGTFSTGATAGFSETAGTLNLNASSTIAFGTGAHNLTFANSSAVSWASGATLTITGWSGGYNGTAGTGGRLFIGSTAFGLTSSQLLQIYFVNGGLSYTATQLSTGEVVPTATVAMFWGGTAAENISTGARWSLLNGGPFSSTWTNGRAAVFNVANSTATLQTTQWVMASAAAFQNITFTNVSSTISTGGTVAPIFVAASRTLDFGGCNMSTAAGTGFIKNGSGILITGPGSAFTGGYTMNAGILAIGGANAIGNGAFIINGGTLTSNSATNRSPAVASISIGGDFQLGDGTNYAAGTGSLTFSSNVSIGSVTRTLTLGNSSTYTFNGIISGTGSAGLALAATATGTLALGGANTYPGATTISGGTLRPTVSGALPSTTGLTLANTVGAILDLSTNGIAPSVSSLAGGGTTGGNIAFGTATTTAFTINQATNTTYAGQITGASLTSGGLVKTGSGVLTLAHASHSYAGTTTITAGELRINPVANATFASQIVLNGGTLSTTGITATRTWTSSSTLNLNANSTIALGAGDHTLTFANSSAVTWAGTTLTITGWAGTAGSSGTGGKIFVGVGGLTAGQLARISFSGFPGTPIILASGELVPALPVVNYTWTGATNNEWNIATNWTPTGIPTATDVATVNAGGAPNISNAVSALVRDLTVAGGASLTVQSGGSLSITGIFTTGGTFNFNCGSTVNFSGASAQNVPALSYGNLNISGGNRTLAAGTINVCNNFTPTAGTTTTTGNTVRLNGTTSQSIQTNAGIFNNLTIANTAASVTSNVAITIASGAALTIDANARLDMGSNTLTITGSTSTVNGFLRSAGTITGATTLTLTFSATGAYEHNANGGTIPTATWSPGTPGATCAVIGATTAAPMGLGQSFQNFIWSSTQTQSIGLNGALIAVNKSFTVENTGAFELRLTNSSTNALLRVGENLVLNGGSLNMTSGTSSSTIDLDGALSILSGVLSKSGSGVGSINFLGSIGQSITNNTGSNISNAINFTVNNPNGITITGTLPINTNATFTRTQGAVTGTVTYGTGTTLVYNNTTALIQSGEWPASAGPVNLTISGAGGVGMSGSRTVVGTVTLSAAAGLLNLAGNTLTLNNGSAAQSVAGAAGNTFTISSSPVGGIISTTGTGDRTITLSNFGTTASAGLVIGAGATLQMNSNARLNVGGNGTSTSMLTITGTLQMNGTTNSNIASGTAPFYTSTSTLEYRVAYSAFQEWLAGTALTTPGVPQNVIVNNSTGNVTIPDVRSALGNFTITSGTFIPSGTLSVGGNWSNAGTFTPNGQTVVFNGSVSQSITRTGGETFFNLTLNNAAGLAPANAVTVTNTLTLTAGNITLGPNNLHITSGNAIGGAPFSTSKMIVTNGAGKLIFSTPTNTTYTYPVGETTGLTEYSPISITFTAGTGAGTSLGMQVVDAAVPTNPLDIPASATDYITRHWLPDAQGFATATWSGSISYLVADEVGNNANLRFSVWHPAPNSTWVDYGVGPSVQSLIGTPLSSSDALLAGGFITARGISTKYYFRSNAASMNWSSVGSWEVSTAPDFGSAATATFAPTALNSLGIRIRSGHTVTVDASYSLDETIVEANATLVKGNGNLTINDGTGDDLEILSGGVYRHATTSGSNPVFLGASNIVVRSGGTIDVTSNFTGATIYGIATNVSYEDNAVFSWSVNNPFAANGNTFFPNATAGVVPRFRLNSNISLPVGGSATTVVNGVLEAVGIVTWEGTGVKVFRNGITGTGTLNQATDCGQFRINGTTSQLGSGSGTLTLNLRTDVASGLALQAGTCTLLGNMSSSNGPIYVDAGATLNAGTNSINGNSSFTLNANATLISANAAGVDGSIAISGTPNFNNGSNYVFNGTVNQVTGSRMAGTVGTLTINNSGTTSNNFVTLSNNNTQATTVNLQAGIFRAGTGNTLRIAAGGTVNGTGGNVSTNSNGEGGTIEFLANGAVTGTPTLWNVTIANSAGGVNFANNATIHNLFTINANGFVNPNAPRYATGSTLVYNSGGAYNRSIEFGNTAGNPGYPHHVLVQGGTTLNMGSATPTALETGGNFSLGTSTTTGNANMGALTLPLVVRGNLTIGASGGPASALTLSTAVLGDLHLHGNFTRHLNSLYTDQGRAVFFRGSGNSTISTPSAPPASAINPTLQDYSFTIIDKDVATARVILQTPTGIGGRLTLTRGIVETLGFPMYIKNPAPDATNDGIVGGSADSYIDGPLFRYTTPASGATGLYSFPIGKSAEGGFRPVRFTSTTAGGSIFSAEYFGGFEAAPSVGIDIFHADVTGILRDEFWQFDRVGGTTAGRLSLLYRSAGAQWRDAAGFSVNPVSGVHNVAVVQRGHPVANQWKFTKDAFNFNVSTPPDLEAFPSSTDGWLMSGVLTTFSPFTVGFSGITVLGVLPVKLLSFEGALQGAEARLQWRIDSDKDLRHFELQYSTDGSQFSTIATVAPAGRQYQYLHRGLAAGKHYYRLLVKEKNGQHFYSKTVLLSRSASATYVVGLQQNPVSTSLALNLWSASAQAAEYSLTDMGGRQLLRQRSQLLPGANTLRLPVAQLPAGVYHLTVLTADGVQETLRVLKQ